MSIKANVVLAAGVGMIAVLAVAAAVISVGRDPVALDPGSPEATVQAYLAAIAEGDHGKALEQLAEDSECGLVDLANAYRPESLEVVLKDTSIDGREAVVVVEITDVYDGGPFDSSGYAHEEVLLLTEVDGSWRLTGDPWPMYVCSEDFQ
jgi:hypothetical protein